MHRLSRTLRKENEATTTTRSRRRRRGRRSATLVRVIASAPVVIMLLLMVVSKHPRVTRRMVSGGSRSSSSVVHGLASSSARFVHHLPGSSSLRRRRWQQQQQPPLLSSGSASTSLSSASEEGNTVPSSAFPAWSYAPRDFFRYEILHHSTKPGSLARVGRIHTPHGIVDTPGYVAVATNAALKGVEFREADQVRKNLQFVPLLLTPSYMELCRIGTGDAQFATKRDVQT